MAQSAPQYNDNAAASSSSPSTSYDVFINHRGPDVKSTFASHLYFRLESIGLRTFLDKQELEEGRTFPSQIKAAIQSATIHIAIFSPNYAASSWCLDELIYMIESRATILPVFYNVEPWELRRTGKAGRYFEALRKQEEEKRFNSETIQKWREALSTAADISGFELKAFNGDEGQLLEEIVRSVSNKIDKTPLKFVAEHPTGLREKLQEFESKVFQGQKEKVAGIVGLGGVGKTTLAKEYFSKRRSHYSRSCFLYDVREKAVTGSLPSLQRKLLKDLTGLDLQIDSIDEGIEELLKHLSSSTSHFLIILDDIDDARQLQPFLPIKDVLSSNSLILITSRDKKILKIAKIAETSVYELKGLNLQDSKKLFCFHAFPHGHPLPEFADLVAGFLKACDGLPLSLKVFGALLFEEDRSYWQDKLNGLHNTLPSEILERLKISYDSLNSKNKEIFLDIVCFFLGEDADTVITICGSVGPLTDLVNKCLLEVDYENKIKMHDQIRDMGRSIAEKESPCRLGHQTTKNIDDLLERSSCGTIEVRGITMNGPSNFDEENTRLLMSEMSWYRRWSSELFEHYLRRLLDNFHFCGILNLQLVSAEGDYLERILRRARAPDIQMIRWYKCTHSSLPSWIPMENLKVLEVEGRKLRVLWERESQVPRQLRELSICAPLSRFPKSIMQLKHFEKIDIRNALFKTLPEELCDVHSLKYLELRDCSELISLPDSLGNLKNLQLIDLTNASSMQMLPSSFGNLIGLKDLFLRGCPVLKCFPNSFGLLTQLKCLEIENCPELKCLPDSFGLLTQLTQLEIRDCPELKCLPDSFGLLTQFMLLTIENFPELKCLPDSFGLLTQLRLLKIKNCPALKCLPDSFGLLTQLTTLNISGCGLKCLPDSFALLTRLEQLKIENCPELKCLPDSFGLLTQLTTLNISGCGIEYLPQNLQMNPLTTLLVMGCPLRELPFGLLTQLTRLEIRDCPELKCLPDSFGLLTQLTQLRIDNCGIEYLPQNLQMNNLRSLEVRGCPLRELPFRRVEGEIERELNTLDICMFHGGVCPNLQRVCPNLRSLILINCKELRQIGRLCGLPKLERLYLVGCENIEVVGCENIEELSSVDTLISLKDLHVRGCARELEIIEGKFIELPRVEPSRVFAVSILTR